MEGGGGGGGGRADKKQWQGNERDFRRNIILRHR